MIAHFIPGDIIKTSLRKGPGILTMFIIFTITKIFSFTLYIKIFNATMGP